MCIATDDFLFVHEKYLGPYHCFVQMRYLQVCHYDINLLCSTVLVLKQDKYNSQGKRFQNWEILFGFDQDY